MKGWDGFLRIRGRLPAISGMAFEDKGEIQQKLKWAYYKSTASGANKCIYAYIIYKRYI